MRILTCKNHPDLRWYTKPEAVSASGHYTGARNIFFIVADIEVDYHANGCQVNVNNWPEPECSCPASDLILAPEDKGDA
jgi:hypothetical protein